MMGATPEVPINGETARAIAEVWVNYQLLAQAAANHDSLNAPAKVDEAMAMAIAQSKTSKLIEIVSKGWVGDTNVTEATYAQGNILSAQHILLMTPPGGTPAQVDSVRRRAEAVLAQARANPTAANFAALAARHSEDQGSKSRGGMYAAFPRGPRPGSMVPEFEKGIAALQPGEIGPLVRTDYGFHVIRRPLLSEVRPEFGAMHARAAGEVAESTYIAKMEEAGKVEIKAKGPATVRAVAQDLEEHRNDRTVVATSTAGDIQGSDVAQFLRSIPQPNQAQLRQQIAQVPDSMIKQLIRQLVHRDLLLKQADSAKVGPDSAELGQMRAAFGQWVLMAWQQLGVAPAQLGDSAKSDDDRERVASARVERYMDALLTGQAQFVQIPDPLEQMLKEKYSSKIVDAGIDRAVEQAQAIRAATDTSRANQPRPPSAVPVPGGAAQPGRGAPPAGSPPPAAPPPGGR
jgi:hypothetical protein